MTGDEDKTIGETGKFSNFFKPKTFSELVQLVGALVGLPAVVCGSFFALKTFETNGRKAEDAKIFGRCAFKVQTPPNIKRLNGYISEGQQYAANRSYDLAAHRFQQVIHIDGNYLGAHQDLGVVQLAQGHFKDAQSSFESEINLIDCMRSVPTEDLHRFAYVLENDKMSRPLSASTYFLRLNAAEDTAHYNLACLFAKQRESAASLDELKKAAEHHSIKREIVAQDSDLRSVQREAGYKATLALF